MDFFLIYVSIAVIAIFLFNIIFKPKFECPKCKTVHTKGDAKSQKATNIRFAHTRKDGERDRRFNQSGTQHYDLTFDCKSCGKEFVEDYSGIIGYYKDQRLKRFADKMLDENPQLVKDLKKMDDTAKDILKEIETEPKFRETVEEQERIDKLKIFITNELYDEKIKMSASEIDRSLKHNNVEEIIEVCDELHYNTDKIGKSEDNLYFHNVVKLKKVIS